MKLWIDTEFNDFKGPLISLAMVDEQGREFYEVLECTDPSPWVAENVMPKLNKRQTTKPHMQFAMMDFLSRYSAIHIIADWPEDIQHFLALLITGPGLRLNTPPITMEICRDLDNTSDTSLNPHNALADAHALRLSYLEKNK